MSDLRPQMAEVEKRPLAIRVHLFSRGKRQREHRCSPSFNVKSIQNRGHEPLGSVSGGRVALHPGHELLLVVHQLPLRLAATERMAHIAFEVVGAHRGIARHLDLRAERHEVRAIHLFKRP